MRERLPFKYRMMMPAIILVFLVILLPLIYSLYVSFHNYILQFGIRDSVGFKNYLSAFREKGFLVSIKNTFVLTVSVVTIEFVIAFAFALLLDKKDLKGKNIYTIILMLPIMMPPITVGLIWRLLLHPDLGIINFILSIIGIGKLGWYGDAQLAMPTVIMVDVWHETSLMLIIIISGLTNINRNYFEAAQIDGARFFQILRFIIIPLLAPVLSVAVLIRMVASIKMYDLIYILTRGGPGSRTETMSYYIYKTAFRKMNMGSAAAESFLLLILIMVFVYVFFLATRSGKNRIE